MKIEALKKRLNKDRSMTEITLQIPSDVVEDLKHVALKLGFSDYQPLIKAYIGQCLRKNFGIVNYVEFLTSIFLKYIAKKSKTYRKLTMPKF